MSFEHPFRTAPLHLFQRMDDQGGGVQWIGRFAPYTTWPVFVQGQSEADVIEKAEAFRAEELAKYEAAWIGRREALEKAREKRRKKEAAE